MNGDDDTEITQRLYRRLRNLHDASVREMQNIINAEELFKNTGGSFKSLECTYSDVLGFKIEVTFRRSHGHLNVLDFYDMDRVTSFQLMLVQKFIEVVIYKIFNWGTVFIPLPRNPEEEIFLPSERSYDEVAHLLYQKMLHPSMWSQQLSIYDPVELRSLYFSYPIKASLRNTRLAHGTPWSDYPPFVNRPWLRSWYQLKRNQTTTLAYPSNDIIEPLMQILLTHLNFMDFENSFALDTVDNILNAGSDNGSTGGHAMLSGNENLLILIQNRPQLEVVNTWRFSFNNFFRLEEWRNTELIITQLTLLKHSIKKLITHLWGTDMRLYFDREELGGGRSQLDIRSKPPTVMETTYSEEILEDIPLTFSNNFIFKHRLIKKLAKS